MFQVSTRAGVGGLETWALSDDASGAAVELVPSRGAIVTRFSVGDFAVLALDEATLADPSKNVRGGIPVLFPTAGRLAGDRFGDYELKQHGFARNLPWTVVSQDTTDAARVTLALSASDETRARFPFEFALTFTFSLAGQSLTIGQRYENRSDVPMPLHLGFHPYFFVPDGEKRATRIPTAATRAYDNLHQRDVAFTGFDLTQPEVDLHLVDHGGSRATLARPNQPTIVLAGSPEFSSWVVWTLAGKDYVCLEPWTAPRNALNSPDVRKIPPHASVALSLTIAVEK